MATEKKQGEEKPKYASEVVDLPSKGIPYGEGHPLSGGQIELKYMTAKEEDILTSQNLIKKGIVIDKLLDSLILTPGVTASDLFLGDKNAIMIAARILAYGPEYTTEIRNPENDEKLTHTFDLSECPFKELPKDIDYSTKEFEFELPVSKQIVVWKLLTGAEEVVIDQELKRLKKANPFLSHELTTRMRHAVVSIEGETKPAFINAGVENMLSRDALALRSEIKRISPDIVMDMDVDIGGDLVTVAIPMTAEFFWPKTLS